jgi:hypothetical protein
LSLTPAEAGVLYRNGMSACEIAQLHRITRGGAEARIRGAGLAGVQWCRIHRTHEELHLTNAEAVSYAVPRTSAKPTWIQPVLEAMP